MPSIIQWAFLLEALANVGGGTAAFLAPEWCLKGLLAPSLLSSSPTPPPSATTLMQMFGLLTYTFTVPLLIAYPDGPHAKELRALTYWTLGSGEALLIPLMLAKFAQGESVSGFDNGKLGFAAASFVGLIGWRLYALRINPSILGGESAVDKRKRK
jgi:hypothetical protein